MWAGIWALANLQYLLRICVRFGLQKWKTRGMIVSLTTNFGKISVLAVFCGMHNCIYGQQCLNCARVHRSSDPPLQEPFGAHLHYLFLMLTWAPALNAGILCPFLTFYCKNSDRELHHKNFTILRWINFQDHEWVNNRMSLGTLLIIGRDMDITFFFTI